MGDRPRDHGRVEGRDVVLDFPDVDVWAVPCIVFGRRAENLRKRSLGALDLRTAERLGGKADPGAKVRTWEGSSGARKSSPRSIGSRQYRDGLCCQSKGCSRSLISQRNTVFRC